MASTRGRIDTREGGDAATRTPREHSMEEQGQRRVSESRFLSEDDVEEELTTMTSTSGGTSGGATMPAPYQQFFTAAILAAVQRAEIWRDRDSKDFVDTRARSPPARVIEALRESRARECSVAAREFLNEHFESGPRERSRATELKDWRSDPAIARGARNEACRAFASHVHELWKVLARLDADDYAEEEAAEAAGGADAEEAARTTSSRIRLPYPAVVPGERFRETYYWDTYWIVLGLLTSEMVGTAQGVTNNLLYLVTTYGFVPNGARVYYLNRSQPPLLSSCVTAVYEATKDVTWLRQALPLLVEEYAYLTRSERTVTVKDPENGETYELSRYFANTTRPRPESYREDVEVARRATRHVEDAVTKLEMKRKIYRHLASGAESGFDFSSRWFLDGGGLETIRTCNIIPADLNGFMLRVETDIAALAREALASLGDSEELFAERVYLSHLNEKFSTASAARKRSIAAVLWDERTSRWRDRAFEYITGEDPRGVVRDIGELVTASQSPFTSDYVPMWCGALERDSDQAYAVVESLRNSGLVTEKGIATSLVESGQQWDFPNAWAPGTHMIVEAIQTYAPDEEEYAKELAHSWIKTAHQVWEATGFMHEKYDVRLESEGVGKGGEYVPQRGFGWTNGVTLRLLEQYGWPDDHNRGSGADLARSFGSEFRLDEVPENENENE
jgi:alpha,alpha-trehalase